MWRANTPPQPETVTVSFNLDGGTAEPALTAQTIKKGEKVTRPTANLTKAGHTFKHWASAQNGSEAYTFDSPVQKSFTLFAVWEKTSTPQPETVQVTFNLDGGTATPEITAQTIKKGEKVTRPTANLTKAGHTFKHWASAQNGTEAYTFDSPVQKSFTLFAVWEKTSAPQPETVTVDFNLDGGTATPEITAQTIKKGEKVTRPTATLTKAGHTFKHWASAQNGAEAYTFDSPVQKSFTLFAVWEKTSTPQPETVTVDFNLDGGTATPAITAQTIKKGEKVTRPTATLTKAGHTFKHWASAQNGTEAYTFDSPVQKSFTLFAVWEKTSAPQAETVQVTFNLDGGTATPEITAQTIKKGEKVTRPTATLTKAGHTFKHWASAQNGAEAYNFDSPVQSSFTLFAVWEKTSAPQPETVTVTFNLDGGTANPVLTAQTIKKGEKVTRPTATLTKAGHTFKHWASAQNGTEAYNFDSPVQASFTLFAVWHTNTPPPPNQTRIYDIQGTAHESPFKGQSVTDIPGIVTGISYSKGEPLGFYMQDAHGDSNPVTSDGIYVYCGKGKVPVELKTGDEVTVSGKVTEYIPEPKKDKDGKPFYDKKDRLSITQLMSEASKIQIKSHSNTLPDPIELTPDKMIKQVAKEAIGSLEPDLEAIDFYESMEGMRVKVTNPKVIAKNFGKTYYIAPYNAPGTSYRGGMMYNSYDATAMIQVYTTGCFATETNSGYTEAGTNINDSFNGDIIGVMDYYNGNLTCAYQIALTEKLPPLTKGSLVPEPATAIYFDEHKLNVVSYNLKNFSAKNKPDKKRAEQFADHFINQLKAPDIICLIEIQDDSGAKDDNEVDSKETLDLLINEIRKQDSEKPYKKIYINPENNQDGGEPGSNIRCAYLYRTDRVELVPDEDSAFTDPNASDTEVKIIGTGTNIKLKENPARIGVGVTPFNRCRKSLVAHFKFKDGINDGKDFFVINNHFSSKRGDAPIWGAQQPVERKSEVNRHQQAQTVKKVIDSILTARSDAMIVSVGDYNDFWFSDTMKIMKGTNMKNAIEALPENQRYTYVYNAHSQTLDNILVPNRPEVSISGVDVLNVNSEFGGKLSDHDPVYVQLSW